MTKEDLKEVKELINKAILKERKRIANRIHYSYAKYCHNYETGESEFNWDQTVEHLKKDILRLDSEDFEDDEEESKD